MEMTLSLDVVATIVTAAWFIQRKLNSIESKVDSAITRIDGHDETLNTLSTDCPLLGNCKDQNGQVTLTVKEAGA